MSETDLAVFQSTLPVWGATVIAATPVIPREISIHAPRVGSDSGQSTQDGKLQGFQSTLPVWGATSPQGYVSLPARISIHAPRVGSDHRLR